MRKAILLGASLALCAAMALAQETPSGSSSQSTTSTTQTTTSERSASGNSIEGCLTGTAGHYMLTDSTGVAYKLEGDDSQLADNVNKQVEVMGTAGSSASASATNNPDTNAPSGSAQGEASANAGDASSGSTGASATANAAKTLDVTSVKKVADTCGSGQ